MSESTFPNAAATGATPPAEGYSSGYGKGAVVTSGDGNTVAFGSPLQTNSGNNAGLVQVFTRSGNSFSQKGSNIIGAAGQRYGTSLALNQDGSILIVGAFLQGLRIYEYSGSDWNLIQTFSTTQSNGDQVVITADAKYLATNNNSTLFIYEKVDGSNSYNTTALASVVPTDIQGIQMDIGYDGSNANTIRILVGSSSNSGNTGLAEIYSYNGSTLSRTQTFSSPAGNGWGSGVSMTSNAQRLAIGSTSSGIVQVYDDDGTGTYVQFGSNITGTASYRFGIRVALSSTNNYLVIGQEWYNTGSSGTAVGRVYLYIPSGTEYVEVPEYVLTGTTGGQRLGTTVAVDDETTIIVSGSNSSAEEAGATLTDDGTMCLTDSTLVQKMVEA